MHDIIQIWLEFNIPLPMLQNSIYVILAALTCVNEKDALSQNWSNLILLVLRLVLVLSAQSLALSCKSLLITALFSSEMKCVVVFLSHAFCRFCYIKFLAFN